MLVSPFLIFFSIKNVMIKHIKKKFKNDAKLSIRISEGFGISSH